MPGLVRPLTIEYCHNDIHDSLDNGILSLSLSKVIAVSLI